MKVTDRRGIGGKKRVMKGPPGSGFRGVAEAVRNTQEQRGTGKEMSPIHASLRLGGRGDGQSWGSTASHSVRGLSACAVPWRVRRGRQEWQRMGLRGGFPRCRNAAAGGDDVLRKGAIAHAAEQQNRDEYSAPSDSDQNETRRVEFCWAILGCPDSPRIANLNCAQRPLEKLLVRF